MPETQTTETETAPELKRQTWRILKLDEETVASVTRWVELEPLSGEGEYGYYPGAVELGEHGGPGSYIIIDADPAHTFHLTRFFVVAAETRYRDATDYEATRAALDEADS